ncbi:Nif11-like leader peptide family natural product precursor [Sphaerospermopsis sp. LEGE 08334]|uniref:Nif11-like leader peptide family natural product precursor n=1 Tax=Sphaerospermopsis sp. LEGE 08334 TaxID=1828651 RepID=UPI00187E0C90|nr:Nif11-like leader peptide family natural product precursor [Sphaerospermopsis sp. LEGE 08334]MBE9057522.1 Nif11-like leader peptide family natural product precursor [Sphaerospermopsis sp. LEGE 08334]
MNTEIIQFLEEIENDPICQEEAKQAEKIEDILQICVNLGYKLTIQDLTIGIKEKLEAKKEYDTKKFYIGFIENHNFKFKKIPEGIGGLDYLNTNIITVCQKNVLG